jgi:hypothetical protein
VITDRELDAQLVRAAAVQDTDLPALPEAFLELLTSGAGEEEPASVIAARQLVSDAHDARRAVGAGTALRIRRRRPSRKVILRAGIAVVAVAAAWTTAVVVAAPQRDGTPHAATPPSAARTGTPSGTGASVGADGIALVAAERMSFPLSVDPVPAGLTPSFSQEEVDAPSGGHAVVWNADYRSADGAGFWFSLTPGDPRHGWAIGHVLPQGPGAADHVTETRTVAVGGTEADLVRGVYDRPVCTDQPSSPAQSEKPAQVCTHSFADLFWQRPDGRWVWLRGEDAYSTTAAVLSLANSLVDRSQPVDLQLGVAPAGWSVRSYDKTSVTLVDADDPDERLTIWLMERWRGATVEGAFQGMFQGAVSWVEVDGRPAKLVLVDQGGAQEWSLAGELDGGALFGMQAPQTLTREHVLEIASRITYTP